MGWFPIACIVIGVIALIVLVAGPATVNAYRKNQKASRKEWRRRMYGE